MKTALYFLSALALLVTGCKTTETRPISWRKQQAYLSRIKDPRIYGLSIYQTPAGLEYRGGGRLHPGQKEALQMLAEEPPRPVAMLRGDFGLEWPVLLDFTSSSTWLDFGTAQTLGAVPVGERETRLVKQANDETVSCLSLAPKLRIQQLHIENPLVYVRFAEGPVRPLERGIEEPEVYGVIGWDLLKKFEQIRFNYTLRMVGLSTTENEPYQADPSLLAAEVPLVKHAPACAVRGLVDGKEELILIDPAGDFEVAADGAVATLQLGELTLKEPVVSESPGGIRIGARLLQNYDITLCPKEGMIYFETTGTGE